MIRLDYRDARPIYEQVRDGLRSMMVTGVLAAGEKLPSVRSLATELAINPNTSSGPIPSWRRRGMYTPCQAGAPSSARSGNRTGSGGRRSPPGCGP